MISGYHQSLEQTASPTFKQCGVYLHAFCRPLYLVTNWVSRKVTIIKLPVSGIKRFFHHLTPSIV